MGSTNHGTQDMTYEYYEEATAEDFNKRHLNIRPIGIYKGGYLVKVSDSEITLSTFTAEIGDGDEQISVTTAALATLNASSLDSGTIASGTPYIVLRWAFIEQQNNYVEVHAIASVAAAAANDIIVGKCVFSGATLTGFVYVDRTFLYVQDLFFKIETSSALYVQLRAGKIQDGSQSIFVPETVVGPFSVPSSPNSRIDLVYIDTDGTPTILAGSAAVSPTVPDYGNKLVIAQVKLVNGDSSIPVDRITDVRSFLDASSGFTPAQYTGGESMTFPNGAIRKQGRVSLVNNVNKTVTFATPFPNAIENTQLTQTNSAHVHGFGWRVWSRSVNSMVLHSDGDSGNYDWVAWGW